MKRPLPMFMRVFGAMVLMVIAGSWSFGSLVSVYQDRATADTVAPVWAAAIRAAAAAPERASSAGDGTSDSRREVAIPVVMRAGQPPTGAYSIAGDGRIVPMVAALGTVGIDVHEVLLEDSVDPPVTWLDLRSIVGAPSAGPRWIGIVGGVQPRDFRQRVWLGIGALVLITLLTSWFVSRWVARPLHRLAQQIDRVALGELPQHTVRGAREIEHLGAAIASMAKQRAAFDEQRRTMLMGVSHDLRSPLTRIRVAADLIEGDPAAARLRDLIVRNVEQADAIIESFAGYVLADAEPVDERVDLAAVARSAAALALTPEQVHVDAAPVWVRGNPLLLSRLLANLVDNAQRHGAAPVAVWLKVDGRRGEVTVSVDDAGAGIADPDRMLRPFERGDAARHTPGSGLGLAIAQRVAARHGGTLVIGRSALGGASVALCLPVLEAA